MAKTLDVDKLLEHPDKDELISMLSIDTTPKQINDWLKSKYSTVGESKLVLSERYLKEFKEEYLDLYQKIREDIYKTKFNKASPEEKVALALNGNSAYKNRILELADKKIDLDRMMANLLLNIEDRVADYFDQTSNMRLNERTSRALVEWVDAMGAAVERLDKIRRQDKLELEKGSVVNNTQINIQVLDQQMSEVYEVIKEILKEFDMVSSMKFMDLLNSRISSIKENKKELSVDQHLAEVKLLSQSVQNKLNG